MQYNTKSCCLSTCRTGNANNRETTTTSRISLDANEQSSLCLCLCFGLCCCCCCCCNMLRHMQSTRKGSVCLLHSNTNAKGSQIHTQTSTNTNTHVNRIRHSEQRLLHSSGFCEQLGKWPPTLLLAANYHNANARAATTKSKHRTLYYALLSKVACG